jgi:exodeoxyribonuclease III
MPFTLATWNINSVRLREELVLQMLREEQPDILCLQECKSPVDLIPVAQFHALGYTHMVARGQKGYNGVAIISKLPLQDAGAEDYAGLGHARHVAARLENGVTIHNHYVPAGGDIPDRAVNDKFGNKLDYLTDMRDAYHAMRPEKSILVGDLNIAPREDDVWNHKALLKIVSHTPVEVDHFGQVMDADGSISPVRTSRRAIFTAGGPTDHQIGMRLIRAAGLIMSGRHPTSVGQHTGRVCCVMCVAGTNPATTPLYLRALIYDTSQNDARPCAIA